MTDGRSMDAEGRRNRLFVATRKGLFRVERGAAGWAIADVSFLGDPVSVVLVDPRDGAVYAAMDLGHFGAKLRKSEDGGRSWAELPAPAYPEKPADLVDVCPMRGTPIPWRVEKIWSLEPGLATQPGRLWLGTLPGGLFRSEDGGASWALVRALWDHPDRRRWVGGGADLPGLHSICVDPRDGRRVLVGVSSGGAWLTEDDGASWACRATGMWQAHAPPEARYDPVGQDPHLIRQSRTSPDVYWCQHHNAVFRSTDGAASWHEVTAIAPSCFGFPVAVHPKDGDTAWFVPAAVDERRVPVDAQVVVSRTRDGGASFEVLRRGLPQTHAYDLVYRHALDVDDSGERLAFGSTTGGLWVSEDGGDSFVEVSAHLPPVYALRFG